MHFFMYILLRHLTTYSVIMGWSAVGVGADPGSKDFSALIGQIGGLDFPARSKAIQELARRGKKIIPELDKTLAEGSWWLKNGVMEALAEMEEAGLPVLVRCARDGDTIDARRYATKMIGRVKHPDSRHALIGLMKDSRIRSVAASALGEVGDSLAVPVLIKALFDPSLSVRRASAKSLGQLRDVRAIPSLIKSMSDSHHSVRFATAGALVAMGPPALKPLSDLLPHPDPLIRSLSSHTIGKIGGESAIQILIPLAGDPEWAVRAAAAAGLGLSAQSESLPILRQWLDKEGVRFVAVRLEKAIRKIEASQ